MKRRFQDAASGPTTYIADGTKVVGQVIAKGACVNRGLVEGDGHVDGTLTVAEGGHWVGTLKATNVVIAGTVTGDVLAEQRIEILESAKILGSVSADQIAIAEGAVIDGDMKVASEPTMFQEKRQSGQDTAVS